MKINVALLAAAGFAFTGVSAWDINYFDNSREHVW
jgi:hypothetical protein